MSKMMFAAVSIARTSTGADGSLALDLLDSKGRTCALNVSQSVSIALAELMGSLRQSERSGLEPTKLPARFAVGSARYEPIVLVRFEDDTPYGLTPELAAKLAQALSEEADATDAVAAQLTQ